MKFTATMFIIITAAACTSDSSSGREARLREALGRAQISLADQVAIAEAAAPGSHGVKAELLVTADAIYQTLAATTGGLEDIRIDIVTGQVMSRAGGSGAPGPCAGSIPIAQAIAIAEAEVNGSAVRVEADDDDACQREVQVLAGPTLWEVEIGSDGTVRGREISDDDEAEADDDDDDDDEDGDDDDDGEEEDDD